MKTLIKNIALFSTLLVITLAGCNKQSYIESIGIVMLESGDETAVGHYLFKATNKPTCSPIYVYVDDKLVGEITNNYTSTVDCKTAPLQGMIVRVVATPGSHKITAKYGNGCKPEASKSFTVVQGKCFLVTVD